MLVCVLICLLFHVLKFFYNYGNNVDIKINTSIANVIEKAKHCRRDTRTVSFHPSSSNMVPQCA